jgi:acetolactate synthase II small subunit
MNYTVYLQTEAQPAALERLLRVVRHRQFELRSLNMEASADRQRLTVRVSVKSDRPIDHLRNQLMKLNDVLWVKMAQDLSHDIVMGKTVNWTTPKSR